MTVRRMNIFMLIATNVNYSFFLSILSLTTHLELFWTIKIELGDLQLFYGFIGFLRRLSLQRIPEIYVIFALVGFP